MNVIEWNGVSKQVKGFRLDDISFRLPAGFITGLIGPNGAGKSTLIRMLLQLIRPDEGEVKLFGLHPASRAKEIKERIGFVLDESHFYEHLTMEEMKRGVAPFYKRWNEAVFRMYADRFELPSGKPIKHYSKGMKMKLSLAFALSHEAELLILDEPTAGLDPVVRREVMDLLQEFIQDEARTVLFSTHITTDLDAIADYILFMQKGSLVFHHSTEEIQENYAIVRGSPPAGPEARRHLTGFRETSLGYEGLTSRAADIKRMLPDASVTPATLEEIMYFTVKGGARHGQPVA